MRGHVRVVDIGIPVDSNLSVLDVTDLALPDRGADAHKWSAGCLVVGGSRGMVGAPLLAGRAALRCGAGMVVCGVPGPDAAAQVSGSELVARALPVTAGGALDEDGASEVLKEIARYRALAIGPGLGRDPATQAAVRAIVAEADVADGGRRRRAERDRGRSVGVARARKRGAARSRCSRRTRASTNGSRAGRWATTESSPRASSRRSCARSCC